MPFLGQIVGLFVVSVLIAYLCHRIRLVPIVGFLIAGVLIGPGALGLVSDRALIDNMAEIGVILLLFTIGVEFSLGKLERIRHVIVRGGLLQGAVVIVAVVGILSLFGVDWKTGVFTGFLVVLSSTVIVLKLLSDAGETDSPSGQITLALLIFQDLAMVLMVLFVPILSGGGSLFDLILVIAKAAFIIAFVLLLARRAIPWLLEKIAQTRANDLFLLTVVMICFGTAWITSLAGVSLALGAFLAGLVVSESRYSGYALTEILPLRTVFNAIFFVSIGMLLNLGYLIEHLPLVVGVAGIVFVLKSVATVGAILALGYPMRIATVSALALAQICESSFVLERAGAAVGLSPAGMGDAGQQTFIAVAVLLMVATPFMMKYAPGIGAYVDQRGIGPRGRKHDLDDGEEVPIEDHVIVVGYGPIGRQIVDVLEAIDLPYVIVELNPTNVDQIEREGRRVLYGDATRMQILEMAGIHRAKLCVIVINDRRAARSIAERANFINPTAQILVRARYANEIEELKEAGADIVVPEELEASVRIIAMLLESYDIPASEVEQQAAAIRHGDEAALRRALEPLRGRISRRAAEVRTRLLVVRGGSIACGQRLGDLSLDAHEVETRDLFRGENRIPHSGDVTLREGDRLVLAGRPEAFERVAHLFRRGTDEATVSAT